MGGRTLTAGVAAAWLAALTAVVIASRGFDLSAADGTIADWSYRAVMAGAALAVATRAVTRPDGRVAWALIATGLVAWTAGDLYHSLALAGGEIPYPSVADALHIAMYVSFIAGLRLLLGRAPMSLALLVILLGVATLWSWLVFSEVLDGATGPTAAVATTVAYPLLDLLLVGWAVLALSAHGWRAHGVYWLLGAGFLAMALADSLYATQIAHKAYEDATLVEALWPAGALCIAAAAWTSAATQDAETTMRPHGGEALTAMAIAVAVAILIAGHFTRVDTLTIALAAATCIAAIFQRVVINGDRRQAQAAADAADAQRRASAGAALDCIVSIDGGGTVIEWNDSAVHTFGYARDEALGADLAELIIPPDLRAGHRAGLRRVAATGSGKILNRRIEVTAMHSDGTEFPVELLVTQVRADPPVFTAFVRDISDRRRGEEENERLAALVRSSNNAIVSRDLSGIVTGWDGAAERVYGFTEAEALGKPLTALVLPPERAGELAEMTESVLRGEVRTFETQRRRKDGTMLDVSLRAFAIRDVRGRIVGVCTSAHDVTEQRRQREREQRDKEGRLWRGRVRTALDEGHLMFWGQPVVDTCTGEIHHHELLLRMDLDGTVVTPNQFLPHAEQSDLITEIDRFAVTTGFELAATAPVAINLSAKSLGDPRLIDHIRRTLAHPELAANVIFEITETAAVANIDAARELVEELRAMGFGVALDDFGTGYGSFTYLNHLPVTELKIDIEFVRGLAKDPTDQRLVRSIISVARNFGMVTVAEGIEDEATLGLMREMGVDFVQGYHIGYPSQMSVSRRWSASTRSAPPAAPLPRLTRDLTPRTSHTRS